jgi:hypothetical protein
MKSIIRRVEKRLDKAPGNTIGKKEKETSEQ